MRDAAWDAKVEHAFATGTCFHCGNPIADGDARYTITNSHWDCYAAERDAVMAAIERYAPEGDEDAGRVPVLANPGAAPTPDGLWIVRASGRSKIHLLPADSDRSLCGHRPKRRAWRMRQRGAWLVVDPSTRTEHRLRDGEWTPYTPYCDACQQARATRQGTATCKR